MENNGWLDLDAHFYPVEPCGHCKWCNERQIFCQGAPCLLEYMGWFKLSDGEWISAHPMKSSQSQIDYIWDWFVKMGKEPDLFIKLLTARNGFHRPIAE